MADVNEFKEYFKQTIELKKYFDKIVDELAYRLDSEVILVGYSNPGSEKLLNLFEDESSVYEQRDRISRVFRGYAWFYFSKNKSKHRVDCENPANISLLVEKILRESELSFDVEEFEKECG